MAADGPAGTVLAYRTDTFHRGSDMTDPLGSRFVLKSSFRNAANDWVDKLHLMQRSMTPGWYEFVNRASMRQLVLLGFPAPGHPYWSEATLDGTALRYPDLDLAPWKAGVKPS